MRVLMIMIMLVLVILRIRYFGLLLCSLIRLCHLSRGQIHAFQEASMSAASPCADERGLRLSTTVRGFDREGQTSHRLSRRSESHPRSSQFNRAPKTHLLQRVRLARIQ